MGNSIHIRLPNGCSCERVEDLETENVLTRGGLKSSTFGFMPTWSKTYIAFEVICIWRYYWSQKIEHCSVFQVKGPNNSTIIGLPQVLSQNLLKLPQTSNVHTLVGNKIAPTTSLFLTPGINGLGTHNWKTRWDTFKLWDLVHLIIEVWLYV